MILFTIELRRCYVDISIHFFCDYEVRSKAYAFQPFFKAVENPCALSAGRQRLKAFTVGRRATDSRGSMTGHLGLVRMATESRHDRCLAKAPCTCAFLLCFHTIHSIAGRGIGGWCRPNIYDVSVSVFPATFVILLHTIFFYSPTPTCPVTRHTLLYFKICLPLLYLFTFPQ